MNHERAGTWQWLFGWKGLVDRRWQSVEGEQKNISLLPGGFQGTSLPRCFPLPQLPQLVEQISTSLSAEWQKHLSLWLWSVQFWQ